MCSPQTGQRNPWDAEPEVVVEAGEADTEAAADKDKAVTDQESGALHAIGMDTLLASVQTYPAETQRTQT